MIKSSASYLDASPDGIVEYNCCGRGVLEVKCLYQCKERSFKDSSTDSTFCLESINDTNASLPFGLRKNHSYYYQVQLQMKVWEVNHCYFVVWSPNEQVTLKIDYDSGFIEAALDKAFLFFTWFVIRTSRQMVHKARNY